MTFQRTPTLFLCTDILILGHPFLPLCLAMRSAASLHVQKIRAGPILQNSAGRPKVRTTLKGSRSWIIYRYYYSFLELLPELFIIVTQKSCLRRVRHVFPTLWEGERRCLLCERRVGCEYFSWSTVKNVGEKSCWEDKGHTELIIRQVMHVDSSPDGSHREPCSIPALLWDVVLCQIWNNHVFVSLRASCPPFLRSGKNEPEKKKAA